MCPNGRTELQVFINTVTSMLRFGVCSANQRNMANKLHFSLLAVAVGLCSCSKHQTTQAKPEPIIEEAVTNKHFMSKVAFKEMIGKEVKLEGIPVGSKANYGLETTEGFVVIDGVWDSELLKAGKPVLVEGFLEFEEAETIPENRDPLLVQSVGRPGQVIPEHFVLRRPKIVRPN